MKRSEQQAAAWKLLDHAITQIPEADSHPLSDEDFLFRLTMGELRPEEQVYFDSHLVVCDQCAAVVNDLKESGLISADGLGQSQSIAKSKPAVDDSIVRRGVISRQQGSKRFIETYRIAIVAACVLALIPFARFILNKSESTLEFATLTTLSDFGYSPRNFSKNVSVWDEQKQARKKQLDDSIKLHPDDASLKLNLAYLYFSVGETALAKDLLVQLHADDAGNTVVLNALGMVEFARGEYSQAKERFELAKQDDEFKIPAILNEADTLVKLGSKKNAIELLSNLVSDSSLSTANRQLVSDAKRQIEALN